MVLYYSRLGLEVQVGTKQGGAVLLKARSGSMSGQHRVVLYYSRIGLEAEVGTTQGDALLLKARSARISWDNSESRDNTGWCCTTQGYVWKYKSGQHSVVLYYSRLCLEVEVGITQGGAVLLKARSGSMSGQHRVVLYYSRLPLEVCQDNTGWCCTTQGYLWKYKSG